MDFDEHLAIWRSATERAGKRPVGTGFSMLSSMKRADAGPAPFLMSGRSAMGLEGKWTNCSHFRHADEVKALDRRARNYGILGVGKCRQSRCQVTAIR
jgi:hypothetical protein